MKLMWPTAVQFQYWCSNSSKILKYLVSCRLIYFAAKHLAIIFEIVELTYLSEHHFVLHACLSYPWRPVRVSMRIWEEQSQKQLFKVIQHLNQQNQIPHLRVIPHVHALAVKCRLLDDGWNVLGQWLETK